MANDSLTSGEEGFGIRILAGMVQRRIDTGSSVEDAIQWVVADAELTSEAAEKLRSRVLCPDHHYRAMGMCPFCGNRL